VSLQTRESHGRVFLGQTTSGHGWASGNRYINSNLGVAGEESKSFSVGLNPKLHLCLVSLGGLDDFEYLLPGGENRVKIGSLSLDDGNSSTTCTGWPHRRDASTMRHRAEAINCLRVPAGRFCLISDQDCRCPVIGDQHWYARLRAAATAPP